MKISTEPVAGLADEDVQAKHYWSLTEEQGREHARTPPHVMALAQLCLEAGARRILEFGCYAGRNLKAIRDAYEEAGEAAPELVGIDINAKAAAWGREASGLDLRVGDERSSKAWPTPAGMSCSPSRCSITCRSPWPRSRASSASPAGASSFWSPTRRWAKGS